MVYLLFIAITVISFLVQRSLQNKFKIYSQEALDVPLTGRDVAAKFLHDNGINNVNVTSVSGQLTDHYNPANGTVNLSDVVFSVNSVAAAAVAAHESGHALQHAQGYSFLKMRTALVPVVSFASQWITWVLLAGILLIEVFPMVMLVGICLFALTTLFSLITLPVEVDASRRAIAWLESSGVTSGIKTEHAKDALHAAAYTYVVAALSSLATLLYYVMIFMGRRR
ncbi:MAG: zinc metallopeptidase [Muribaculaceae bacterium]|nr:zinc metallopeptidase [Muribaculaceae bacterium]MBR5118022.1 zinc metallopeptidase [Muribaculaceae bacterium]